MGGKRVWWSNWKDAWSSRDLGKVWSWEVVGEEGNGFLSVGSFSRRLSLGLCALERKKRGDDEHFSWIVRLCGFMHDLFFFCPLRLFEKLPVIPPSPRLCVTIP